MDVLLAALGSTALFASRAFLPAFMTACALRWRDALPFLGDSELIRSLPNAPTWFTSDACLAVLGILSVLEIVATKNPDARGVLHEFDRWLKPVLAVATYFGLASSADAQFAEKAVKLKGALDASGLLPGLGLGGADAGIAALVGGLAWWLSGLRGALMSMLHESDEDDAAGVQKLLSWGEDAWALFGPIIVLAFPFVMLGLSALVSAGIWWLRRRAERREDASRAPCRSCGEPTYLCALACAKCGTEVEAPRGVTWLGATGEDPAPDRATHPYRLLSKKRCPRCATRLKERTPHQRCPACARDAFGDPAFVEGYLASIRNRVPLVLAVCAAFSLVPVVGLIPGVVFYRMTLVAPFRRYVSRTRGFVTKWLLVLLFLFLATVQGFSFLLPGSGLFAVPVLALANWLAWRRAFLGALRDGAPAAAALPAA